MFRKTSGAILCPSCGRLTNADAPTCLVCGRRNPGMWGFAGPLRGLFHRRSLVDVVIAACVVLYVLSLVVDPTSFLQRRDLLGALSPTFGAQRMLGAAGTIPWQNGEWWTPLTAVYLHGGPLHLLLNMFALRFLGLAVEEVYGAARFVIIFTLAGVIGFAVSNAVGYPFTLGASGGIFGLLGAMVAYGQKRGGTFGGQVLRQYAFLAILVFVQGMMMESVNNVAHAGGFAGGFATGLVLALAERQAETAFDRLFAAACIGLTLVGFGAALYTALV
jgi:rhomboid protease GluP